MCRAAGSLSAGMAGTERRSHEAVGMGSTLRYLGQHYCGSTQGRLARRTSLSERGVKVHIHEGYGVLRESKTTFINASICDAAYRPINAPVVLELKGKQRDVDIPI